MRIALITTLQHNPGDDFVRAGIKYLLKKQFGDTKLSFHNIHKHAPITARYGFGRVRRLKKFATLDSVLPRNITPDKILQADLVVQCGAPVYWCHNNVNAHCCDNEWYRPLVEERFLQKTDDAKFLNIAGGSCQTYYSDGSEFCPRCLDYIRKFFSITSLTTLRDQLANDVLQKTGAAAPVLPCTSLFAGDEYNIQPGDDDYIVVNYMPLAGHYAFSAGIDKGRWQHVLKTVYGTMKKSNRIIFVCHAEKEKKQARLFDPGAAVFYSKNYVDYLRIYAGAKFGIVNRIHGAYALAAFGKPSVVIGNDSRTRMADEIGISRFFINDVDVENLLHHIDRMRQDSATFAEKSRAIKKQAFTRYMEEMAAVL